MRGNAYFSITGKCLMNKWFWNLFITWLLNNTHFVLKIEAYRLLTQYSALISKITARYEVQLQSYWVNSVFGSQHCNLDVCFCLQSLDSWAPRIYELISDSMFRSFFPFYCTLAEKSVRFLHISNVTNQR